MRDILRTAAAVSRIRIRNDDDFSDRIHHRYTVALLCIFSFVTTSRQLVGRTITCWVPKEFTGSHKAYAHSYCWVKNTYYLPFNKSIPKVHEEDKREMIVYYQWVPMILLFQALLFYLPCFLWRSFYSRSGIDIGNVIEAACTIENCKNAEKKETSLKMMTNAFDLYLGSKLKRVGNGLLDKSRVLAQNTCCVFFQRRYGNYIVMLFSVTKVIYIVNSICQLFLLNVFLGTDYNVYGFEVMYDLANTRDWKPSPRFPRVTICDFKTRRVGNIHRYSLQCVLPINLFNEKIFIVIWFWLVVISIISCITLISWFMKLRVDNVTYIKSLLHTMDRFQDGVDKELLHVFVERYLRMDGVFLVRLVSANSNSIVAMELVDSLWGEFLAKPKLQRLRDDPLNVEMEDLRKRRGTNNID